MSTDPSIYVVTADSTVVDVDLDDNPALVNGDQMDEQRASEVAAEVLKLYQSRH